MNKDNKTKANVASLMARPDQEAIRADLTAFFGPNAATFLAAYEKIRLKKGRGFSTIGWSWPAFLVAPIWFIYRKTNAVAAVISLLPFVFSLLFGGTSGFGVASIVVGLYGKSIYVQTALRRVLKADKLGLVGQDRHEYLTRAGGVSVPAAIIATLAFAAIIANAILYPAVLPDS